MGALIRRRRRLEWVETDASGGWHNSAVWRFAEWAEAELHRDLGISHLTFGYTPRRRVEAEFLGQVRFDDVIDVELVVAEVGRTSATYAVTLAVDGRTVATARMVVVFIDAEGRAAPWPEPVAAALRGDGHPLEGS